MPRIRKVKNEKVAESKKKPVYRNLILLNLVFIVAVMLVLWRVNINQSVKTIELPSVPDVEILTSTSTPTRLLIPTIGLDSKVQLVGKTSKGKMAVPNNFADVGWYKLGYYPGTIGNAVIAGHLDNGKGKSGVFVDLNKIRIGDEVLVLNNEGKKLVFKVTGMSLYDYDNAPLGLIFGSSTAAHLNLITCDGIWIPEKKIYDKRLVVFTDFTGIVK